MLLEFKTKNYKSFKEELCFSMEPAPKQTGLDYSIINKIINNKNYKTLSSAVVYGANASGKTNIIGAMEVFKNIILHGDVKNKTISDKKTPNFAVNNLELIPNVTNTEKEDLFFSIKFIEGDLLFEYKLVIDIGNFLEASYERKIVLEELFVNEELVFSIENQNLKALNFKSIDNYLVNQFEENQKGIIDIIKNNLPFQELFLTSGFKTMVSVKIFDIINTWLTEKFVVVYKSNNIYISPVLDKKKEQLVSDSNLNNIVKLFGGANNIGYFTPKNKSEPELVSMIKNQSKKGIHLLPCEIFESYGTVRFSNIFPLIAAALIKGCTLVIDEFDASLHPMVIMNIINIFHNDEINKNNAQLIFNTHNPIFLNSNLFRRDEIKFVERDDETHLSSHYSLSDFGTSGENGVRKNEDYMRNYFISRYGAIKNIDFSPIFDKIILEKNNNGKKI